MWIKLGQQGTGAPAFPPGRHTRASRRTPRPAPSAAGSRLTRPQRRRQRVQVRASLRTRGRTVPERPALGRPARPGRTEARLA